MLVIVLLFLVEIPFENPRRSFDRLYNWVASKKNHRKLISQLANQNNVVKSVLVDFKSTTPSRKIQQGAETCVSSRFVLTREENC